MQNILKLLTILSGIYNIQGVLIDPIMVLRSFPKETGINPNINIDLYFEKHTNNDPQELLQFYKFTSTVNLRKSIEKIEKQLILVEIPYYIVDQSTTDTNLIDHRTQTDNCPPEITTHIAYSFEDPDIIIENIDTRKVSKLVRRVLLDPYHQNSRAVFFDNSVIDPNAISFKDLIDEYNSLYNNLNDFKNSLDKTALINVFDIALKNCEESGTQIADIIIDIIKKPIAEHIAKVVASPSITSTRLKALITDRIQKNEIKILGVWEKKFSFRCKPAFKKQKEATI